MIGTELKYASWRLKGNEEVVKASILQDWNSLQYATEDMRRNKKLIKIADKN